MKKWILLLVAVIFFCSSMPLALAAKNTKTNAELDKINRELNELRKQKSEAQAKARKTQQQLRQVQSQKRENAKDIRTLLNQIDDSTMRLGNLNKQIKVINSDLEESITKLGKAKIRVYERDEMLKNRMRLLYTNGNVSYMEVLLNAADFSDFLDRYSLLSTLVQQDRELLVELQKDRDQVAAQKNKIEYKLASLSNKYLEVEDLKVSLQEKEEQKEQMLTRLVAQEQLLEDISEEQEQELVALAKRESDLLQKKKKYDFKYTGGKMAWPVPASKLITSYFGYRSDPFTGRRKLHKGLDIGAPAGTRIVAAEQGVVVVASRTNGYGNTVIIEHGKGVQTWYGHIRNGGIKVRQGQEVERGDFIAEVGSTGQSTGNHLHFEVRIKGAAVNPLSYLR